MTDMNQRWFGVIVGALIVILVVAGLASNDYRMAGMATAMLFLLPMVGRPEWWWMAAVATMGSGLASSFPGDVKMHLLALLGFVLLVTLPIVRKQESSRITSLPQKSCIVLLLIIIATASYRGWGLKFLDGEYWGGMQYINLIASLLFYILSRHVTLTWMQAKRALVAFFLLSLVPAVALIISHFIPHGELVQNVVEIGSSELEPVVAELQAIEVTRWAYMQYPSIWMGILALICFDRRFRVSIPTVVIAAVSFVMMGLSGHRTVVVLLGMTLVIYLLVRRRLVRLPQLLKFAGVLTVLVASIYLFINWFPLAFQRAFASLPGINISYEAGVDAMSTSDWRVELWRQLLSLVPDYLWIGRGLAFSASDAYSAAALVSDRNTQYVYFSAVHLYHNGPLWFIIDLGVAGLTAGVVFMISGMIHYGRMIHRVLGTGSWEPVYVVFYALFVSYCLFFFLVIGGGTFMCHILIIASVLDVIGRSAEQDRATRGGLHAG